MRPKEIVILVATDGNMTLLDGCGVELERFGSARRSRASHDLPVAALKRSAFRLLRLLFGECGRVSEWTRGWRGPWQVTFNREANVPHFVTGTVAYTHAEREKCLAFERRLIQARLGK